MDNVGFPPPRECLLSPLPEHDVAADLLASAADALLGGEIDAAHELVRNADLQVLKAHANKLLRAVDPQILQRRPVRRSAVNISKVPARMPRGPVTLAVHLRDGWRCRYCGCRVVSKSARDVLRAHLPTALPWAKADGYHAAFLALTATVDHITAHAVGGDNQPENLVSACWPCQFGRAKYSLDELGLIDPRVRAPRVDGWDGLTRIAAIGQKRRRAN